MTADQAARVASYHQDNKSKSMSTVRLDTKRFEVTPEWERAHGSAHITLKLLRNYPCDTEALHEWRENIKALVYETLAEIREQKKHGRKPERKYVFWYDVVDGMSLRLQDAIEAFPNGKHMSPIQCM
jgi:hypothetical protein